MTGVVRRGVTWASRPPKGAARVKARATSRAVPRDAGPTWEPVTIFDTSSPAALRDASPAQYRLLGIDPAVETSRAWMVTPIHRPGWRIRWAEMTPSQNELMRRYREKHAYERLLKRWATFLGDVMMVARIPQAAGRRRLEITRYVRAEEYRLDRGNLIGGCKPVLDAAVRVGLLLDDREEHLDDHYSQRIDPVERVEILVSDC